MLIYIDIYRRRISELSEGQIVTRPVIRFIGDTAVLQCKGSGSASLYWVYTSASISIASTRRGVYPGHPRLSLNATTEDQFDLMINSAQRDDAGTYLCTSLFDTIAKAELILLGTFFRIY